MRISGEQIWRNEQHKIKEICDLLRLEDEIIGAFTHCERDFGFTIQLERDNGLIEYRTGWRVKHVNPYDPGRKPFKGGFTRALNVGRDLCRAKASWMTWKCALIGPTQDERIPFGGAKGGLRCDPKKYSLREMRRQMQECAKALDPVIGPTMDSLGPDAGVGPEEIRAFISAYSELNMDKGIPCGAVATGKPLEDCGGGCPGRLLATGRGLHYVYEATTKLHPFFKNIPPKPRAIIQGFGNVGSSYALLAKSFGVTIIGASDVRGGVYNPKGIDIKSLYEYSRSTGSVVNFPEADNVTNDDFLHKPCDILVLAATEAVLTDSNADGVQASVILEGANGPTLPEAQHKLIHRGVFVIPHFLANAGGVTVSYFEWCQDMQGIFWSEKEINNRLKNYMVGGVHRVLEFAKQFNTDLYTAGYISALSHCAPALRKNRGWKKSIKSLF